MLLCQDHLEREMARGAGSFSPLPTGMIGVCHVSDCKLAVVGNWLPDVDQDEIKTPKPELV